MIEFSFSKYFCKKYTNLFLIKIVCAIHWKLSLIQIPFHMEFFDSYFDRKKNEKHFFWWRISISHNLNKDSDICLLFCFWDHNSIFCLFVFSNHFFFTWPKKKEKIKETFWLGTKKKINTSVWVVKKKKRFQDFMLKTIGFDGNGFSFCVYRASWCI